MNIELETEINEKVLSCWPSEQERRPYKPFLEPAFLQAMVDSNALAANTGWQPLFILFDGAEAKGLLISFIKSHSYGEYVFDWQWANAYHQSEIDYYPKLLSALPFSPIPLPKVFFERQTPEFNLTHLLNKVVEEFQLSGWHYLYNEPDNYSKFFSGSLERFSIRFSWQHRGYRDFDDFLSRLKSKTRKSIRRERRQILDYGLTVQSYSGEEVTEDLLKTFYRCYANTYWVRQQKPYLAESFFRSLLANCPESILLIVASKDEEPVACSWFFRNDDQLYGRYWGELRHFECLHFELCYYQGIEYCIRSGIKCFDPGTQGEHKVRRGFEPALVSSFHDLVNPSFRDAIANFCQAEREHVKQELCYLQSCLPFKSTEEGE